MSVLSFSVVLNRYFHNLGNSVFNSKVALNSMSQLLPLSSLSSTLFKSLCYVVGKTLNSHCGTGEFNAGGNPTIDKHYIQGKQRHFSLYATETEGRRVAIFLGRENFFLTFRLCLIFL